jgi:hypothetical protein
MNMKRRKFASLTTGVLLAIAAATPAVAQEFTLSIGTPPPGPIVEAVPPPRPGFVWAPGHWRWENERHVWMSGRWIEERPGYRWISDRWIGGANGSWRFVPGYWEEIFITARTPPPTLLVETVPPPRPGSVWAPGHWRWENERHVWVPGRWIEERAGYRWVSARWIEAANGSWRFVPGHWAII